MWHVETPAAASQGSDRVGSGESAIAAQLVLARSGTTSRARWVRRLRPGAVWEESFEPQFVCVWRLRWQLREAWTAAAAASPPVVQWVPGRARCRLRGDVKRRKTGVA